MNKRKVLEAARKFAQKGAKEKALKEYNTLLKADPKDAKLLLEIGEWHRRWGNNDEAIGLYTKVAEQYKQGGFDARAVAVFKQILNLDSKRYPAYVDLAELYQRMGLESEAINSLQVAADGYHKEGQKREALELLRKMATLDPSNTTSRLKVAELLRQEDMNQDALAEYEAVVEELKRQGELEQMGPVYERMLELAPERVDIQAGLARMMIDQGQAARAENFARAAFDAQPDGPEHFELVSAVYKALDKEQELTEATRTLAQIYRERGEESKARELMQRLPGGDVFEVDAAAVAGPAADDVADVGSGDLMGGREMLLDEGDGLGDDDLLDDDFLAADGDPSDALSGGDDFVDLGVEDELELGADDIDDDPLDDEAVMDSPAEEPLPEGDPDQLFAEASVYLRYGKRDQAIASLKAILAQDPAHRDALEKIGECYADGGDAANAVENWTEAARLARVGDDEAAVDILRERIAVLDPSAAAALVSAPPVPRAAAAAAPEAAAAGPAADDFDLDIDIDFNNDDVVVEGEGAPPVAAPQVEDDVEILMDEAVDVEIAIDDEPEEEPASDEASPDPDEEHEMMLDDVSVDVDVDVDVDVEIEDETPDAGAPAIGVDAAGVGSAGLSASSAQSRQIEEDLEEAEFYFSQEIYDEAEAIYERILQVAPNHPSALLRLGEVRAARGEDPNESTQSGAALSKAAAPDLDIVDDEVSIDPAEDLDAPGDDQGDLGTQLGEDSELDIAVDLDVDDVASDETDAISFDDETDDTDPIAVDIETDEATETDVEGPDAVDLGAELDGDGEIDLEAAMADAAAAVDSPDLEPEMESDAIDLALDESDDFDTEVGTDSTMQVDVSELEGAEDDEDEVAVVFDGAGEARDEAPPARKAAVAKPKPKRAARGVESPFQVEDTMPFVDDEDEELVFASEAKEQLEAEPAPATPPAPAPEETEVLAAAVEEPAPLDAAEVAEPEEDDEDAFDLGAELRESLEEDGDEETTADPGSSRSGMDDGFDSIFKDFKAGVSKTLSDDDHETRFDLGIAYREMELYDDAIGEFTICLGSPDHRLESLHMMGLCALDLGHFAESVNYMEQALATEGLDNQKEAGLHFDLGRAFEAQQSWTRAQEAYSSARDADPSIPGIEERITGLEDKLGTSMQNIEVGGAPDDAFESFDDLVAEVEADVEPEPAESLESFDDMIADVEAEAELDDDVTMQAPEVGELVDEEPDDTGDESGDAGPSKPRKKRISFV